MPDVFISYAHEDNDYPRYGQRGWVECFYEALKARLNGIRREETTIWRDQSEARITGATVLTPTIEEKLSDCGVLVVVVSPAYLSSKWCADELRFFRNAAGKRGGLSVTTKSGKLTRVLKVLKLPVEMEAFRTGAPEIDDAVGYPLYLRTSEGRPCIPPIELDPPYGENMGTDFSRAVNGLAYDIDAVLLGLSPKAAAARGSSDAPKATVYLAETSSDMADYRDRMRQELEQFGFSVVPAAQQFPGPTYAAQVKDTLKGARLSVHLVGDSYGMIPERANESIVELQYGLAGEEKANRPAFDRLVWMPPGINPAEERQRSFVSALQDDPRLAIVPLEEFKTLVHDALAPKTTPAPQARGGDGARKGVYLMFDNLDADTATEVNDWLTKRGFRVWTPTEGERDKLAIAQHKQRLSLSSGVLIFYGETTDDWIQRIRLRLIKDFALKTIGPKPCGVMLADPKRPDKERFRDPDVQVIPGFGGFSPERLEAFAREIEATSASA